MSIYAFLRARLIICVSLLMGGFIISGRPGMATSFDEIDLRYLIDVVVAEFKITPIIIDPDVRGSIRIAIFTPLSKEDAFSLFLKVLKFNYAMLIRDKGIYKVVPTSSFRSQSWEFIDKPPEPSTSKSKPKQSPVNNSDQKPPGSPQGTPIFPTTQGKDEKIAGTISTPAKDIANNPNQLQRYATYIVEAKFVPVKDLIEVIKPFMTDAGVVMPFERRNILILSDYADAWDRIWQAIQ
jgi:type II secretory pathway component GspD/PulD (secretin)